MPVEMQPDIFTGLDEVAPVDDGGQRPELDAPAETPEAVPETPPAPSETPEAVPETPAPPAPPAEPTPEQRFVPLQTMIEERQRLQARLEAEAQRTRELETRLAKLEAPADKPAAETPEPDFLEDPKGYIDARLAKAEKAAQAAAETGGKAAQMAQQAEQQRQFTNAIANDENRFVTQHPDYLQALGHLREQRAADLQDAYPTATVEQITQALTHEELALAAHALRNNRSPAELAYSAARRRGWTPNASAGSAPPAAAIPGASPFALPTSATTLGAGGGAADLTDQTAGDGLDMFDAAQREALAR